MLIIALSATLKLIAAVVITFMLVFGGHQWEQQHKSKLDAQKQHISIVKHLAGL